MAEAIGVTTYSSFFALHSFFDDVDILIMDDVHSCEDYIISNWTIILMAFIVLNLIILHYIYRQTLCKFKMTNTHLQYGKYNLTPHICN